MRVLDQMRQRQHHQCASGPENAAESPAQEAQLCAGESTDAEAGRRRMLPTTQLLHERRHLLHTVHPGLSYRSRGNFYSECYRQVHCQLPK